MLKYFLTKLFFWYAGAGVAFGRVFIGPYYMREKDTFGFSTVNTFISIS